jgi:hypothetical protein
MSQADKPRERRGVWIGASAVILVGLVPSFIQNGAAIGIQLSKAQLQLLFYGQGIVIALGIIGFLYGVGLLGLLRENVHLHWPVTFGEDKPRVQLVAVPSEPKGEIAKRDKIIEERDRELEQWGKDELFRRYRWIALHEFPDFQVAEAERIANMLYGVYKKPLTDVLLMIDRQGEVGFISFWPYEGSIRRPFEQADLYRERIRKLVTDAKNRRIDESDVQPSKA